VREHQGPGDGPQRNPWVNGAVLRPYLDKHLRGANGYDSVERAKLMKLPRDALPPSHWEQPTLTGPKIDAPSPATDRVVPSGTR
jgi:hypothetical protein